MCKILNPNSRMTGNFTHFKRIVSIFYFLNSIHGHAIFLGPLYCSLLTSKYSSSIPLLHSRKKKDIVNEKVVNKGENVVLQHVGKFPQASNQHLNWIRLQFSCHTQFDLMWQKVVLNFFYYYKRFSYTSIIYGTRAHNMNTIMVLK